MHRIDGPGATVDNRFTDGDPVGGVQATMVTDDWANDVQEELISILADQGIAPVKGTQNQILTAIKAIAAAYATVPQATTTVLGGGKTASASDALVGTSALLLMTPAAFNGAAASESFRGTIKRATQALVNALANDTDAITPLKLGSGFVISKAANGHIKFPDWLGGLIIQWGVVTALAAEATTTVTFSLTFPGALRGGLATVNRATAITGGVNSAYFSPISTSQATIVNDGSSGSAIDVFWLAIGN